MNILFLGRDIAGGGIDASLVGYQGRRKIAAHFGLPLQLSVAGVQGQQHSVAQRKEDAFRVSGRSQIRRSVCVIAPGEPQRL